VRAVGLTVFCGSESLQLSAQAAYGFRPLGHWQLVEWRGICACCMSFHNLSEVHTSSWKLQQLPDADASHALLLAQQLGAARH
jgi:hypothetical protein